MRGPKSWLHLLTFSCIAFGQSNQKPNILYASSTRLQVDIKVLATRIELDSKGVFEVSITNKTKRPLWVNGLIPQNFFIDVKDHRGNPIEYTYSAAPPPSPFVYPEEELVCLHPGHTLSSIDPRTPADLGIVRPGRYSATAEYSGMASRTKKNDYSHMNKTKPSATVEFEVRSPAR